MLEPHVVREAERLIATGVAHREVARRIRISRATVGLIAHGKRVLRGPAKEEYNIRIWNGPEERCPGCGGMVYMPCLVCGLKAELSSGRSTG